MRSSVQQRQEAHKVAQLACWQVLERWHRHARCDKHLFEFAGGKPRIHVGEVLSGSGVAGVADFVTGQAAGLGEDRPACLEFVFLASSGAPHPQRNRDRFFRSGADWFSEREVLVFDAAVAVAGRVDPAVTDRCERGLGGYEPSSGDFFEAEPIPASPIDHKGGLSVAFDHLACGQREDARCLAPPDHQAAGICSQGEHDMAGDARGRGDSKDLLHGLFTHPVPGAAPGTSLAATRGATSEQSADAFLSSSSR